MKYAIAYLSLFDGEIKQVVLEGNSELEVLNQYLQASFTDLSELDSTVSDQDAFISALKLE